MPTLFNRLKNNDKYQKEEGVHELDKKDDFTCNKEGKFFYFSNYII